MTSLYDRVLHSKLGGSPAIMRMMFTAGLKARKAFFAGRDIAGRFLRPRRRQEVPQSIRKILLIRTDRVGDIVLSTPALGALHRRYPQAEIDYVVQGKYAPILNCYEGWKRVFTVDINDRQGLRSLGKTLCKLRYDVVVVEHPSAYAYGLARDARGKCTIGWKAKGYGHLLDIGFVDDRAVACRHQVENNCRLMSAMGVDEQSPQFPPLRETETGINEFTAFRRRYGFTGSEEILAIHPGSYSWRVRWHPQRFGELADRACKRGLRPVIFGAESDHVVVEEVSRYSRCGPVISIGDLGLEGLVSFLKNCRVFVGNSTGPMHIAASAGIWTIAVFGSRYPMDSAALWRPWGPRGIVVTAPDCTCRKCLPWTCPDMACLSLITVDQVWEAVESAMVSADSVPPHRPG